MALEPPRLARTAVRRHPWRVNDHELGFLKLVAPPQQRRLQTLLELGAKRRPDVRSLFDHAITLDPRYAKPLAGGQQFPDKVWSLLLAHGAPPTCYIISSSQLLDGQHMPTAAGLAAVMGSGNGAFISCLPGKLGYFEGEDRGGGRIVWRPDE